MRIAIRLQPRSSCDRIDSVERLEDGSLRLKCRVTAVADKGKANAALLALLSATWRVPKSALTLVTGATARNKIIEIAPSAIESAAAWISSTTR